MPPEPGGALGPRTAAPARSPACLLHHGGAELARAESAAPRRFRAGPGSPAPSQASEAPVNPAWWSIFGDPELASLERRVAAENLDVADATQRVMESLAESSEVSSQPYPNATANASYARERASPNGILGLLGTTTPNDPATVAEAPRASARRPAGQRRLARL